jgi:hypothetical protein
MSIRATGSWKQGFCQMLSKTLIPGQMGIFKAMRPGDVADFGGSSLPRRTSRPAATCVHVNQGTGPISCRLLHTGFALRRFENPFRQKGTTFAIILFYPHAVRPKRNETPAVPESGFDRLSRSVDTDECRRFEHPLHLVSGELVFDPHVNQATPGVQQVPKDWSLRSRETHIQGRLVRT